jgi:hypothetical protein
LDTVWIPISSTDEGALVDVVTMVCNIKIQRSEI